MCDKQEKPKLHYDRSDIDKYLDTWEFGLCSEPMSITVLFEKFDVPQHKNLVKYINNFFENYPRGWLSEMRASSLEKANGGIQMTWSNFDAVNSPLTSWKPLHEEETFEETCQICYSGTYWSPEEGLKFTTNFGKSDCKILTFTAKRGCPRRLMLELHKFFVTHLAMKKIDCGASRVIDSEGYPSYDDLAWHQRSIWEL